MSTTVEEVEKVKTSQSEKSELLLDSLEIKGYRCFEHLTIEKLGRVNLIVGKNNVGKTALLEALLVYASAGDSDAVATINYSRGEVSIEDEDEIINDDAPRHLFYKRPVANGKSIKFSIGSIPVKSKRSRRNPIEVTFSHHPRNDTLKLKTNQVKDAGYSYLFLRFDGISIDSIASLWDDITLTPTEETINSILKIIAPELEKINFAIYPKGSKQRIPLVKIMNCDEPLPLRSLGEGVYRLLAIILSLVNCEDGILLIDEIEIGLHYSVQLDIWRAIFKTARNLNVQVFATTHSSDCIKAFQRAAGEDKEDEGMLIRLARKGDKIKAVLFDEREMETVVENDIEVR